MLIEIIVTSLDEAIQAEKYGANRLELIHGFEQGGLSPQLQLSQQICAAVKIPVNVMLRPHGDSFHYSNKDMQQIMLELDYLREHTQANAIVFGGLDAEAKIDCKLLELIINNKGHLGLTFHRAIDVAANTIDAYTELLNYPEIDQILTSGGKNTALDGYAQIRQMVRLNANRGYCKILAGSGVTPSNAKQLIALTKVEQIHLGTGVRENGIFVKNKFDELITSVQGH